MRNQVKAHFVIRIVEVDCWWHDAIPNSENAENRLGTACRTEYGTWRTVS